MFRKTFHQPSNIEEFKQKLLRWGAQFEVCCFLNNNNYPEHHFSYSSFEIKMAVNVITELLPQEKINSFSALDNFIENNSNWLFGFLTYELKDSCENLKSTNPDNICLPELYFFQPQIIITIHRNQTVEIELSDICPKPAKQIFEDISSFSYYSNNERQNISVMPRVSREKYLENVKKIKSHILRGDIYELNYCIEFFSHNKINPVDEYLNLQEISPAPFASFFRYKEKYLLCASPERYLKKTGNQIISQPIKGTSRRGITKNEDDVLKTHLYTDTKERAENIMIVDLVRNDLSKIAARKSVKVEELCGIYTFEQVHQMISTVSARNNNYGIAEILKHTFPMGSMTGAPKIKAMKLIEKFENSRRGLYSGAVGYISPEKDFDFNVVIRSMIYNAYQNYLSFMVGSAITSRSVPEHEYDECLLKAKAIRQILNKEHQYA